MEPSSVDILGYDTSGSPHPEQFSVIAFVVLRIGGGLRPGRMAGDAKRVTEVKRLGVCT